MNPHIRKPIIYLPSRALIVPCSYDPEKRSKVEYRRVEITMRYEVRSIDPIPREWMEHNVPGPIATILGAPIRFRDT